MQNLTNALSGLIERMDFLRGRKSIVKAPKTPIVSVIIPTYNRPKMIEEAIKSVQNQTYKNFEIIVVNDAGEGIEDVITSLNKGDIIYVRHSINKGPAAARNTGIRLSKGKYIAYLDDDDIFYPNHLETLVEFLKNSRFKIAYTDVYGAEQIKTQRGYEIIRRTLCSSIDFSKEILLLQNIAPINSFMHDKSCFKKVGLFDESLNIGEDWDLWIRMSKKFNFFHIRKATAEYRYRKRVEESTMMHLSQRTESSSTGELIHKRYIHSSHPYYAFIKAKNYFDRKMYKEAIEELENFSLIIKKRNFKGTNHCCMIPIYYALGSNYEKEGSLDKAKEKFEEVLKFGEKIFFLGDKNKFLGGAHFHLGCIYQKMEEKEKAKEEFEECLKLIPTHRKAREYLEALKKEEVI